MKVCRLCGTARSRGLYLVKGKEYRICSVCVDSCLENGQVCRTCNIRKPITEYRRRSPVSWHSTCKKCQYLKDAQRVRENPDKKAYHVLKEKEYFSARNNLEFDLDTSWYLSRIEAGHCEVTGFPLVLNHTDQYLDNPYQPEIDRILAGGNYTKENCRVVCRMYNRARGNTPEDLFVELCRRVVNNGH